MPARTPAGVVWRVIVVVVLTAAFILALPYLFFVLGWISLIVALGWIAFAVRFVAGPSTTVFPTWLATTRRSGSSERGERK